MTRQDVLTVIQHHLRKKLYLNDIQLLGDSNQRLVVRWLCLVLNLDQKDTKQSYSQEIHKLDPPLSVTLSARSMSRVQFEALSSPRLQEEQHSYIQEHLKCLEWKNQQNDSRQRG